MRIYGTFKCPGIPRSLIGRLICFDLDEDKLKLAKKYGADACYRSDTEEGKAAIRSFIEEGGFDIVVECSGSQPGLSLACDLVKTCGTNF